jgi:hypothetical protein
MATATLDILVQLTDAASAGLKTIGDSVSSMKDQFKAVGEAMTGAGAAITGELALAVKAAGDAQAQMAQFNTILADSKGVTDAQKDSMLAAADAAVKMGFDDEDSAVSIAKLYQRTGDVNEAIQLNAATMDLARAKGMDLGDATNAVSLALSGQGRALAAYGISVKDLASPLDVLQALQSKVGGQAQAFSQTFEGQSEAMTAEVNQLQEAIGQGLLPALTQIVQDITPIIEKMMEWMEAHPKLTQQIVTLAAVIGGLMLVLGPILIVLPGLVTAFTLLSGPVGLVALAIIGLVAAGVLLMANWDTVKDFLIGHWQEIVQVLFPGLGSLVVFFADNWGAISDGITQTWQAITSTVSTAFKSVSDFITATLNGISATWQKMWTSVRTFFSNIWAEMVNDFKGAINLIISGINTFIRAFDAIHISVPAVSIPLVGTVGGFTIGVPQIPSIPLLAQGGIVTGPTLAMVGEAGPEAVIPLNRLSGGAGGITINFQGDMYSTKEAALDFANEIARVLRYNKRI